MIRSAGAREVHMRVSSAPITGPCYYGIDTPNREELIAANLTVDEIAPGPRCGFPGIPLAGGHARIGPGWVPKASATRASRATTPLHLPPTRISCASGAVAELAHSLQVAAHVPASTFAPLMTDRSASPASSRHVYFFGDGRADGTRDMRDVLGGKGANLAEMTNLGDPGPAGVHHCVLRRARSTWPPGRHPQDCATK